MGKNIHTLEDLIQPMTSVEVIVLWFNLLDNTGSLLKLFVQRGSDVDSFECGVTKVDLKTSTAVVEYSKLPATPPFCDVCFVHS